jgi:hypothetical protein
VCCIVLSYRENVFYSNFLPSRRRDGVVYHLKQSFNTHTHTSPLPHRWPMLFFIPRVLFIFEKNISLFFFKRQKQNCFYFFRLYSKLFVLHILAGTAFRVTAVFITVFCFFFLKDTTSAVRLFIIFKSVRFVFLSRAT